MTPRPVHAPGQGPVLWGRIRGTWSAREWDELHAWLHSSPLPDGSHVVLDFSEARHMHFRTAPRLLQIARELEERGAVLCVTGLSEYLRRIVEVACALEGRDFLERYGLGCSPLPDPADTRFGTAPSRAWRPWGPQDLAALSLN